MGWHPQDEDFTTPKQREKRGAGICQKYHRWNGTKQGAANWVWLYNEAISLRRAYGSFNALARPDRQPVNPASSPDALR